MLKNRKNNMKALNWILKYLKDWKNLLTHAIIGVLILCVAFYMPVKPVYRIILLLLVVGFNIIRMKKSKKTNADRKQNF